eukprot:PhF_6_TR13696/c0_g1_i2/m.22092/K03327/TC.MATE, SLC47A, norM, mdtK, dinF; multidrug resistance protein, MATE family
MDRSPPEQKTSLLNEHRSAPASHLSHRSLRSHISEEHDDTWATEFYRTAKYSFPISLSTLASMARGATDVAFLGHMGIEQLAGGNLAGSLYVAMSVLFHSAPYAMSPLCAQSFGARNFRLVGVWFQITLIFQILLGFIFVPVTILITKPLLGLCDLSEQAIDYGSQYMTYISSSMVTDGLFETVREYLKAQNIIDFPSHVCLLGVFLNVGANYLLIYGISGFWGGLGFIGSPLAYLTVSVLEFVIVVIYVISTKGARKTWTRFRLRNMKPSRIKEFLKMYLGTFVGMAVDLWVATVVSFLSGAWGNVHASAQGILYNIWCVIYSVFFGVASTTETRVAQHLGTGNAQRAIKGSVAGFVISFGCVIGVGAIYYPLSYKVDSVYSTESDVLNEVEELKLYLLGCYFLSAMGQTLTMVLTACTMATKSAAISTMSSLCVQLPLCYVLGFHQGLKLKGLWLACMAGEAVRFIAGVAYVARINWEDEALEAKGKGDLFSDLHSGTNTPQHGPADLMKGGGGVPSIGGGDLEGGFEDNDDDDIPDFMLPTSGYGGTPPHSFHGGGL